LKVLPEWLTQRAENGPVVQHRNLSPMAAMLIRMAWQKLKDEERDGDELWAVENPANIQYKLGRQNRERPGPERQGREEQRLVRRLRCRSLEGQPSAASSEQSSIPEYDRFGVARPRGCRNANMVGGRLESFSVSAPLSGFVDRTNAENPAPRAYDTPAATVKAGGIAPGLKARTFTRDPAKRCYKERVTWNRYHRSTRVPVW